MRGDFGNLFTIFPMYITWFLSWRHSELKPSLFCTFLIGDLLCLIRRLNLQVLIIIADSFSHISSDPYIFAPFCSKFLSSSVILGCVNASLNLSADTLSHLKFKSLEGFRTFVELFGGRVCMFCDSFNSVLIC